MMSKLLLYFVLFMMQGESITHDTGSQSDCTVNNEILTCEHTLPTKITSNVSSVVVNDYQQQSIVDTDFTDSSWNKIISLDVTVNEMIHFILVKNNFIKLKMKLNYLGIHAPRLAAIHEHLFRELISLRTLDLSNCVYLNEAQLLTSIMESQLRLTVLNLRYISSGRPLQIDQKFMRMISETKTERLSLSGSNLIIKGPLDFANLKFKLSYFDISNTSVTFMNLSHSSEVSVLNILAENLKDLNMSYIRSRFLEIKYNFLSNINESYNCNRSSFFGIISKVDNVCLNGILKTSFYANNSLTDVSACIINLKSLYLKDNNIHYLNATIKWPKENDLKTIDLSANSMKYLNPDFFFGLSSLEVINLSQNELSFMEKYEDFSSLFKHLQGLQHCNMSYNKLKFIPKSMFKNNEKIVTLDLSNNDLTSLAFDLVHLKNIQTLWFKGNRFKFLKERDFEELNFLLQGAHVPDIDISGNPLECSCNSVKFLKWMSMKIQPHSDRLYLCQLEGQTHLIDETTIEKSNYLCVRSTVIIMSVCGSAGIAMSAVSIAGILFLRYKKRQRTQTKVHFLHELTRGTLSQKHLCFLSFASNEDYDMVTKFCSSIDTNLQKLTGIQQRTLVCMGDSEFRPGYAVVNEIFRVVNQSIVFVCLVSREFCASKWCNFELRIAYENSMPVILICKEELPRSEMPALLLNIFNTSIRAKLVIDSGQYCLIQGNDILCQSIFDLALKSYADSKTSITLYDGETSISLYDRESPIIHNDIETPITHYDRETPITLYDRETPITHYDRETQITLYDREKPITHYDRETPITHYDRETPITL